MSPSPTPAPSALPPASDPIVALATAPGRGAVGIVRASGPDLAPLVAAVCGAALPPRQAVLRDFLGPDGVALDRGLALFFPGPHSVTGEDVLELQAHGGPVLLQLLLARCLAVLRGTHPHARLAEPGEFTQRAFLNGKLDLAQAEAVADLIDASTEAAARSAARSLQGAFSAEVARLAAQTVELRTLVEATLDFPEEEVDFLEKARALPRLDALLAQVEQALARTRQGALLREGLRVVLAGQPNVGKSSLLNALAGAELAIVTPIPGTTRDRISQTLQVQGVPLHVTDTAGLRTEVADEVERIGVERSWQAIAEADVVIFLRDLTRCGEPAYDAADAALARDLAGAPVLQVWNKADAAPAQAAAAAQAGQPAALQLSARSGAGLQTLRQTLLDRAGAASTPEGLFIARSRHVDALRRTLAHLQAARTHAQARDAALDLLAEELRLAHRALGEITGQFSTEDLLGEIFGRFCIGK